MLETRISSVVILPMKTLSKFCYLFAALGVLSGATFAEDDSKNEIPEAGADG